MSVSDPATSRFHRLRAVWRVALTVLLVHVALMAVGGRWELTIAGTTIRDPSWPWMALLLLVALTARALSGERGRIRPRAMFTAAAHLPWRWRHALSVTVLVLIGLGFRLRGLGSGLPVVTHPDEPGVMAVAVQMLRVGSLDPNWFIYPTLYLYLIMPFLALQFVRLRGQGAVTSLQDVSHLEPGFMWAARFVSAIAGTLLIVAVYRISDSVWPGRTGKRAGLVAAALVTFSFIHIRESHYALTDTTLTLLAALALGASLLILQEDKLRYYFAAGFLGGLAGAAKYSALPIVGVILAAHLLGRPWRRWLTGRPLLGLVGLATGFFAGAPFAILNWSRFVEHLGFLTTVGRPGDAWERFSFMVGYGMESGFGPIVMSATLASIVVALHRRRKKELLLAFFVIVFVAQVSHAQIRVFPRYWLPALPGIALLLGGYAAMACEWVVRRLRWKEIAVAPLLVVVTVVAVWPTAAESLEWTRLQTLPDSRALAHEWILSNVEPGSIVVSETRIVAPPEGIEFRLAPRGIHERTIGDWRGDRVQALIATDAWADRADSDKASRRGRRRLTRRLERAARFEGRSSGGTGPALTIYRVPYLLETRSGEPETAEQAGQSGW